MGICFYYGSGSPYAWRVWFGLEHKGLPYEMKTLSFSAGDLQQPAYLAINPRHKVPALTDGGFAIYESAAILDYLEDAYPDTGSPLLPKDARGRGRVRRLIREADEYLARALETMVEEILFKPREQWDAQRITKGRDAYVKELGHFEGQLEGDFFAPSLGSADYTIYPLIALALRMEGRNSALAIRAAIGPRLQSWMARMEALPAYARTYPPHWKTS